MTKRFVVAVDGLTKEQENAVSDHFRIGPGWWHWIGGFWLVRDNTDKMTCVSIRKAIKPHTGDARSLIFEVSSVRDYAGYGPKSEAKDMFRWIDENWRDG